MLNNYSSYPNNYQASQPNYIQPWQQTWQQVTLPQTQIQPQMQNQSPGFVRVQCENDARMYPVAPGSSILFYNENEPYFYTKTVDVSQLDRPKFEKYRLVKEDSEVKEESEKSNSESNASKYVLKDDFDSIIEKLNERINNLQQFRRKNDNIKNNMEKN